MLVYIYTCSICTYIPVSVFNAALYSEVYRHTSTVPTDSRSPEVAGDRPSLLELRLVAMHLPDWEKLGRVLLIDQSTLDQCKKSHRYEWVNVYHIYIYG